MSATPYASPAPTTPWVPLWPLGGQTMGELAYAERTTVATINATTFPAGDVILTAPAITCDGLTPIIIEFQAPYMQPPSATTIYATLFEDGVMLGIIAASGTSAALTASTPVHALQRRIPSAGTHVYSIRATINSASGGAVGAGAGGVGNYNPAFIRISLASPIGNAPPGATLPVQYGTTLPVGPVNGQEAILVDSLTAPTYQWRFRYNAGSASAYKWEYIGGAPLYGENVAGQGGITSTSFVAISGGPVLTVPRAGDYDWVLCGQLSNSGANNTMLAPKRSSAAATDDDIIFAAPNSGAVLSRSRRWSALTQGETISPHLKVLAGTGQAIRVSLSVVPVRVA